ncbi:MAG: hypothetical protein HC805_08815 [Alkalinema sp. RL_2_19]|nr:hypothetical protein [Alkalinema sp. RL_2_19]
MALELVDHPAQLTLRTGIPCIAVTLGLQRADNTLIWLSVNAQPMFREGEMLPYEVVLTLADITQRKQADHDRRESRRREQGAQSQVASAQAEMAQILESVTDGFIACDRDWRFTYINREAARTIGRSDKVCWVKCCGKNFLNSPTAALRVASSKASGKASPVKRWNTTPRAIAGTRFGSTRPLRAFQSISAT